MGDKPILSVVEEIKGPSLDELYGKIYNAEFWPPFIPLDDVHIEKKDSSSKDLHVFSFNVKSKVYMDALKTLSYDFQSEGIIKAKDLGIQGNKGHLWKLMLDVKKPEAKVEVNLRAKDINGGLKVGVFVYKLDFDMKNLELVPFGLDAILFAGRVYLRDAIKRFEKKYPQIYK